MAKRRANDRAVISGRSGIPPERITINGWWPMHCDCYHEQAFDDANPRDTVEWYQTTAGTVHAVGGDTEETWNACRNEDARWGRSHEVVANVLGLTPEEVAAGLTPVWSTDRLPDGIARVLDVALPPQTNQNDANQIQGTLDAQFGAGAIRVSR